ADDGIRAFHVTGVQTCALPIYIAISRAGDQPRPDEVCEASETWPLCNDLVRVLGDDGLAHGPWNPRLSPDKLRELLRLMALTRTSGRASRRASACLGGCARV